MLISLNWLNDYIDVSQYSADDLASMLTDLGLEVEGITQVAPLPDGLVLGKIVSTEPHPNADSLQKCKVDIGADELLDIVCGAKNARSGLTAAVATIGTVLPGDFKIKPSKIRGEKSEGMMCSQKELGISEEDTGLWEIESSLPTGTPISKFYDTSDSILEVSLTPNRADCLSYIGIARDLAAKTGKELKTPHIDLDSFSDKNLKSTEHIKLAVAGDLSLRFCAISINGIQPSASPTWMQKRLITAGMRPINLIVDVTNYVLMETGQPIHAYDKNFLEESSIYVREAKAGEVLKTLDGNAVKLEVEDILICDGKKPVGLAGIMGGENSEVKDNTNDIIVEVAEFSATKIRKTSKRVGLHTEASHRFERGVDINAIPFVAKRVGQLLYTCSKELGLTPPKVANDIAEIYSNPRPLAKIALRLPRARQMLAMPLLSMETCVKNLDGLGIKILDHTDERMLFEIPSWRQDIIREVDLIEEVARIEGFDKIPYRQPVMDISPTKEQGLIWFTEEVKLQFAQLGLSEVITFPFMSKSLAKEFGICDAHPFMPSIQLANPINEDLEYMQTSLLPGLLSSVMKNRNRGNKGCRLFEVGRSYFDFNKSPINKSTYPNLANHDRRSPHYTHKAAAESQRPTERPFLGCVVDAPFIETTWQGKEVIPDFYTIKKIIYNFLHSIGANCTEIRLERPNEIEFPFMHPNASALIKLQDNLLGWMGELHPRVSKNFGFDINQPPVVAEIDVEYLYLLSEKPLSINVDSSKFPAVTRDLALLVNQEITHGDFEQTFANFKSKYLKNVRLFDIYKGPNLPEGKMSYAYTASFQASDKTLTDKEVDKEVQSLIKLLEDKLQAEQR